MTPLGRRIAALIEATGPISVADYMAMCLFDPQHGYYTTREPFGRDGDFTTAPEISQMFGEIVGVWLVTAWRVLGSPIPVTVAEIGPGRGTLAKDMLRTIRQIAPELHQKADVVLIETSPRLTEIQCTTLGGEADRATWDQGVDALLRQPLLIVGNELFDAVPIRQYVRTSKGWNERLVGLDDQGKFGFIAGPSTMDGDLLPADASAAPEGAIVELAPARNAIMDAIAARISADGGAGLFIDYGHEQSAVGDTLQAMRSHAFDPVLAHPGEADLTAHVDFDALSREARRHGLETALLTQGDFLLRMGLLERAGSLGAGGGETTRDRIRGEVERLASPDAMGTLFKALCVAPAGKMPEPFRGGN